VDFNLMPFWLAGVLIIVVPTLLAMAGTVLVRRRFGLERLSSNNEVAGFQFATVGVLYAVLLAFAVIVVWERFSDVEDSVAREGGAAATLYRLSDGMHREPGPTMRNRLTAYLESAISQDWPALAEGHASPATTRALADVYSAAMTYAPADDREALLMQEILSQLDNLVAARRDRVVKSPGVVPAVLWPVMFGGAIVTIGFTFFFGTKSLLAQTAMTGALSLLIFAVLLVIVTVNRPFAGTIKVYPEALVEVLEDLGRSSAPQ
jgi:uncharacterized protein DUF4239